MADLRELDIRHLAALDAVATTGTFARAANKLGYTQSAVSQQISALERLVDAPLFDRPGGPKPAVLTPLGKLLAARARELLVRVDAIGEEVDRVRDGKAGTLGIGTFQSFSAVVLPRVLSVMRDEFPDLILRLVDGDSDEKLLAALESGETDISFIGGKASGIEAEPVLSDAWVLLARTGHFADGAVKVSELSGEPLVGQPPDVWQNLCEAELRAAGVVPNFVFRSNDNTTMAAMVRAGIGTAVMPVLAARDHALGLTMHHLDPPLAQRRILMARRTDRTLPASASRFIEITRQVCDEVAVHGQ